MVEPSKELEEVFKNAVESAKKLNHEYVTIEHVLFSMLSNSTFVECIDGFGAKASALKKDITEHLTSKCSDIISTDTVIQPKKTASFERMLNKAFTQVIFNNRQIVEISDIFIMIMN